MNIRLSTLPTLFVAMALVACGNADRQPSEAASPASQAESPRLLDDTLAAALGDPDAFSRARRLAELLPTLGPEAIPEVEAVLDRFRLDLSPVEFLLLLRFWAIHDPAAATAFTFDRSSALHRVEGARTAIEIWAEQDPASAVVAAESALREANVDVARALETALVRGWFKNDREGVARYVQGLGAGLRRQRALFAFLLSLASADGLEAVEEFAEAVPDDDLRYKQAVFRQAMATLAWVEIPYATRFCDEHCDGPYAKGMRTILVRTRLRDGEPGGDIVEWASTAPENDEKQRETKKHDVWVAYTTWAHRDRAAAVAWMTERLQTEPHPQWLRNLYAEYARQLAPDSPTEAIRWAERVEDDTDRERTQVRVARYWLTLEPEAAEQWIEQSDLNQRARAQARDLSQPNYLPVDGERALIPPEQRTAP